VFTYFEIPFVETLGLFVGWSNAQKGGDLEESGQEEDEEELDEEEEDDKRRMKRRMKRMMREMKRMSR